MNWYLFICLMIIWCLCPLSTFMLPCVQVSCSCVTDVLLFIHKLCSLDRGLILIMLLENALLMESTCLPDNILQFIQMLTSAVSRTLGRGQSKFLNLCPIRNWFKCNKNMCMFKSIENYQNWFQAILHWDIAWTTEEKELQASLWNRKMFPLITFCFPESGLCPNFTLGGVAEKGLVLAGTFTLSI